MQAAAATKSTSCCNNGDDVPKVSVSAEESTLTYTSNGSPLTPASSQDNQNAYSTTSARCVIPPAVRGGTVAAGNDYSISGGGEDHAVQGTLAQVVSKYVGVGFDSMSVLTNRAISSSPNPCLLSTQVPYSDDSSLTNSPVSSSATDTASSPEYSASRPHHGSSSPSQHFSLPARQLTFSPSNMTANPDNLQSILPSSCMSNNSSSSLPNSGMMQFSDHLQQQQHHQQHEQRAGEWLWNNNNNSCTSQLPESWNNLSDIPPAWQFQLSNADPFLEQPNVALNADFSYTRDAITSDLFTSGSSGGDVNPSAANMTWHPHHPHQEFQSNSEVDDDGHCFLSTDDHSWQFGGHCDDHSSVSCLSDNMSTGGDFFGSDLIYLPNDLGNYPPSDPSGMMMMQQQQQQQPMLFGDVRLFPDHLMMDQQLEPLIYA